MRHDLISMGDYDILSQYELSFSLPEDNEDEPSFQEKWKEMMALYGLESYQSEEMLTAVFKQIRDEFAATFGEEIQIHFMQGFITRKDSQTPVRHAEASRVFSSGHTVYLDLLMSSVLYSYAVVFYVWALSPEDRDIASESFKQSLYLFDGCCRKGLFPNLEGMSHLLQLIHDHLTQSDLKKISDLYSCMLAFAICHETGHIFLHHDNPRTKEDASQQEYLADQAGYDIFLKLMLRYKDCRDDLPENVFRQYLYTAPMILFLFYHCLFTTGYWLFGEQIHDTHPDPLKRIDRLLEISQEDQYDFDTEGGNAFLAAYWDCADQYLEELFYKLKNGKLSKILLKGDLSMDTGNTLDAVFELNEQIQRKIKDYATENGYDPEKCIGLWNVTAALSADLPERSHSLIISLPSKKGVSVKPFNIVYKQKTLCDFLLSGLTISPPQNRVDTGKIALYILFKLAMMSEAALNEAQISVVLYLHQHNGYTVPVSESEILENVPGATPDTITQLDQMHCIEISQGTILLREKVIYHL